MQATMKITEQEYKVLESHVKKAVMMDRTGFMSLTICDKILGRLYLALEMQGVPEEAQKQAQRQPESIQWWDQAETPERSEDEG